MKNYLQPNDPDTEDSSIDPVSTMVRILVSFTSIANDMNLIHL